MADALRPGNTIKAQANGGHGGNIRVVAEQFIPSVDSLVSASSCLGIDGQVVISASNENLGNKLFLILPDGMMRLEEQFQEPCSISGDNMSSFTVASREGTPTMPDDLVASGPLWSMPKLVKTPAQTDRYKQSSRRRLASVAKGKECSNQ